MLFQEVVLGRFWMQQIVQLCQLPTACFWKLQGFVILSILFGIWNIYIQRSIAHCREDFAKARKIAIPVWTNLRFPRDVATFELRQSSEFLPASPRLGFELIRPNNRKLDWQGLWLDDKRLPQCFKIWNFHPDNLPQLPHWPKRMGI